MKRRVVITGIGAISPIGNNAVEMWENAKAGVNGIDFIKNIDVTNHGVKIAGEVKDYNPKDYFPVKEAKRMDKSTQFGVIAAREAIKDSEIDLEKVDLDKAGVIVATGIGGLQTIENEYERGSKSGFDRISPFFIPMAIVNILPATISIEFGFKGTTAPIVTACAAATNSIGQAFREIAQGYLDLALAGGSEASITHLGLGGFTSMKALNESNDVNRASIPFDKDREGFVMGEGAGILLLEEYEHAKARGAKIYAEIIGYGTSSDAYHITSPTLDGEGAAKSMANAIKDGEIDLEKVGYINAHGTSTPLNDKIETTAIKTVFKEHAKNLKVSSTKSMTGHLLGASGGIESIFTILALKEGIIPPTINYKNFDEECDLDIVPNKCEEADINYALKNSFGFGGHNATLLFKKYED